MTSGPTRNGLMDCGEQEPMVPRRLDEEIGCAARTDVPVLITGNPDEGREIACAIDRRSRAPQGTVDVVDCRQGDAFSRVMSYAAPERPSPPGRSSILLLQEVHALSLHEQAEVDDRLAALRAARPTDVRIIASSSTPLFERVREGAFDERLYYRLNVIHMVVD